MSLVYVVPVHEDEAILEANVARLRARLGEGDHVLLVENGSHDRSFEIATALAGEEGPGPRVLAFHEDAAGIGYAYDRGLREALARLGPAADTWAVLTASDLPFDFTDVDASSALLASPGLRMIIGSKAHPESRVERDVKRRAMTAVYRGLRRALVGMRVGDSQGSILLRMDLAAELVPLVAARNFFYSTELCHHAERRGERIVEVPVVLAAAQRASTVRARHALDMLEQLWALRGRRDS